MTQIHTSRSSDSVFIDTVWQSQNITDGTYLATPDGSWDLIMAIDQHGRRSMLLAGQATKSTVVPYAAGTGSVVISFAAGAFLPHLSGDKLLNAMEVLPNVDDGHFNLAGHTFAFPAFENAEELVAQMAHAGVLKHDHIVEESLKGAPKAVSDRSTQRHFIEKTGITRKQFQQINRAQDAVKLLKQGKKPVDAAIDAGYSDQPHLAKSLKRIMGSKPSDVEDIHKL